VLLAAGLSGTNKALIAVVAAAFICFALTCAMLIPRFRPAFPGNKGLPLFLALSGLITAGMMATVIFLAGETKEAAAGAETTTPSGQPPAPPGATATRPGPTGTSTTAVAVGDPVAGKAVFLKAGCVACHTLKAAGATGTVGPNLDEKRPPAALVIERVTHGKGVMPPFGDSGQLTAKQIHDVAAFVVSATQQG
jgi:mono/diheme cytochrome c family protein